MTDAGLADADARKAHWKDAEMAWRWIKLRMRPGMTDAEVSALVVAVLREKRPDLEELDLRERLGIVERLTAAALRERDAPAAAIMRSSRPAPHPVAAFLAGLRPRHLAVGGLVLVAAMLAIDLQMTLFILGALAPIVALLALMRALRGNGPGGTSGGCSGGSCGT